MEIYELSLTHTLSTHMMSDEMIGKGMYSYYKLKIQFLNTVKNVKHYQAKQLRLYILINTFIRI